MLTDEQYRRARRAYLQSRGQEVDRELLELLWRVASRFVRASGLPPVYSPTGRWDRDSAEELLGDWMVARLMKGQLKTILDQAATPGAFARLAEAALRKHAITRRERSQSANLFGRLRIMLPEDGELAVMHEAARDQDRAWGLRAWGGVRAVWTGDDKALASAAWGLGHFDTVKFKTDAKKLSHLLEADDLRRFVHRLLDALGRALTLGQIVRALELRFDLEPVGLTDLGEEADTVAAEQPAVADEAVARRAVIAVLGELTQRQVEVLHRMLGRMPMREIATELDVSLGTVATEWSKVTEVLRRVSDSEGAEHQLLLNILRDLLF